jgi:F-type H+/Na+-transporting ATPase subunit alpha
MPTLSNTLDDWLPEAQERLDRLDLRPRLQQVGRIEQVGDGIAHVSGLTDTRMDELLAFPGEVYGQAVELGQETIGCVLLGPHEHISAGDVVHGTGSVIRVPVGDGLLGRVVDPLGRPLDDGPAVTPLRLDPVERQAPPIIERARVTEPLQTGTLVIDAMFPLGRGQRELIIGDRATGKSAIALDAIINQHRSDVIGIYVAVGQKASSVRQAIEAVRSRGAFDRTLFVIATADAPPGLQWLAPFAGFTMAEHFRDTGRHALIVVDDLTKHAAVHRQIALLLRQPPGREAYPGDVFYLHSRLLERAAKLAPERGGGSLTALPIAETQAGNLSAYIPTNLISITDGQIYLDAKLFYEGQKPAVDVGRSVSRVGGATQAPALRKLSESLRLDYAQFLELEMFTRFGGMADERTRRTVEHGRRIRAVLSQPQFAPLALAEEAALLLAVTEGLLEPLPLERITRLKAELGPALEQRARAAVARIHGSGGLDDDSRSALLTVIRDLVGNPS